MKEEFETSSSSSSSSLRFPVSSNVFSSVRLGRRDSKRRKSVSESCLEKKERKKKKSIDFDEEVESVYLFSFSRTSRRRSRYERSDLKREKNKTRSKKELNQR